MSEAATPSMPEPYCAACGFCLTGCVDSSKCPECGRPLVEVLVRGAGDRKWGRRFQTEATMWGLPLVSIATGATPDEPYGTARGIIAIGDRAVGLFAMGGLARGVVAIGGQPIGLFAFGGMPVGLIGACGGMAAGLMTWGGMSLGMIASGGFAIGYWAVGGAAGGRFAAGGARLFGTSDPAGFDAVKWFYGPPPMIFQPMGVIFGLALMVTGLIAALVAFRHWRGERRNEGAAIRHR